MNLPTRPPSGRDASEIDMTQDAKLYAGIVATGFQPFVQAVVAAGGYDDVATDPIGVRFRDLESAAYKETDRNEWEGRWVEVRGQYVPSRDTAHRFTLMRQKIQCCGADVIQLNVPILTKEPVTEFAPDEWVKVIGKVEFRERPQGGYTTVLQVPRNSYVTRTEADASQYLQN
jgi:hypothetical protein